MITRTMSAFAWVMLIASLCVDALDAFSKSWCAKPTPPPEPGMYGDLHGSSMSGIRITPPLAESLFQQAVAQEWNFNKHESLRNFKRVVELAPGCALCWWGIARGLGSSINHYISDPEVFRSAAEHAKRVLKPEDGPKVHLLVSSIQLLASNETAADVVRVPWGYPLPDSLFQRRDSYAAAICNSNLTQTDADIAALCVDAMMAAYPWNYYTEARMDHGPSELRRELRNAQSLLARLNAPSAVPHTLAKHLYIHLMEPRTVPLSNALIGVQAGDALENLSPGSGHLQHMPAHIYLRVGRWLDGMIASQHAVADNAWYVGRCLQPYTFGHNFRLGGWHAKLAGARVKALNFSHGHRDCASWLSKAGLHIEGPHQRDGCSSASSEPVLTLTQFGLWQNIVALGPVTPCGASDNCSNEEFHYGPRLYALGMAHEAFNQSSDAEYETLAKLSAQSMNRSHPQHSVIMASFLEISARRSYTRGDFVASISALRNLTKLLDAAVYIEPPEWYYDPSNCLGYVLLKHGKHGSPDPAAAMEVYQAALRRFPGSGWALLGAAQAEIAAGRPESADAYNAQFRVAWANADVTLASSCPQFDVSSSASDRFV